MESTSTYLQKETDFIDIENRLVVAKGEGSDVAVSCGAGCRLGLDLILLWLWCKLAALVRPLAWEQPYASGAALKKKKKKKRLESILNLLKDIYSPKDHYKHQP